MERQVIPTAILPGIRRRNRPLAVAPLVVAGRLTGSAVVPGQRPLSTDSVNTFSERTLRRVDLFVNLGNEICLLLFESLSIHSFITDSSNRLHHLSSRICGTVLFFLQDLLPGCDYHCGATRNKGGQKHESGYVQLNYLARSISKGIDRMRVAQRIYTAISYNII